MKYKLINKQTGVETLCDKVTIDGFDYYVSDNPKGGKYIIWLGETVEHFPKQGTPQIKYGTTVISTVYSGGHAKDWKELVATNNPNIDIPKVVDEVERLKFVYNEGGNKDVFTNGVLTGIEIGYNKSQETHPFSGEDMIEFYEWCNYPIYRADGELGFRSRVQAQFPEYNTYIVIDETGYSIHPKGVFLTTEELLQLWKDQKPKTVYCS